MLKIKKNKVIIILKNFLFFLLFLIFPLFLLSLVKFITDKFNLFINDALFFATINYFIFLSLFFILFHFQRKEVNFFSNENWFYTLGNALIPSIIAFGIGFLITFVFIFLADILPVSQEIKEWINLPNQGYIEIFNKIRDKKHFFIIIWIFYIIVIAPVTEEILFRGTLQKAIGRIFKFKNIDCYIVAFIFSLFHISSLSNAIFSFVVGYFLSLYRKKTNSLNTSIWIHSIINFIGLLYGIIFEYKN